MEIRYVTAADAERLAEIYAPYVRETAVCFEYDAPTVAEFRARIERTLEGYPYIAAVEDGVIVGYAYAAAFHGRPAYLHSVEVSIYVDRSYRGKGIGRALYTELENLLKRQNVYILHACVVSPDAPDQYLNHNSREFHLAMGYQIVGKHTHTGYKFGNWYNILWMDKQLCDLPADPPPFVRFGDVDNSL